MSSLRPLLMMLAFTCATLSAAQAAEPVCSDDSAPAAMGIGTSPLGTPGQNDQLAGDLDLDGDDPDDDFDDDVLPHERAPSLTPLAASRRTPAPLDHRSPTLNPPSIFRPPRDA